MNENELQIWVDTQRLIVEEYLVKQGINKPNVGSWPAFEVAPYFAIWAVESKKTSGKIGWWAFSGDCPTDYVAEDGKCHPRNALRILLDTWGKHIKTMKSGKQPVGIHFGDGSNMKELGDLLEKRISILANWHEDDSLWEDR